MSGSRALLLLKAIADHGIHHDQGRPVVGRAELVQRLADGTQIIAIRDMQRLPAIGAEALGHVLGEGEIGEAFDRNLVVVVDPAEVRELEMAGHGGGFGGDALHHVAVAAQDEDVMVEQLGVGLVVARRQPALGQRHPDRITAALPERTRRRLDARRHPVFRVARRLGGQLAKLFDVVQRDGRLTSLLAMRVDFLDARQMQDRIEQHRTMADRQHEPIAVRPVRRGGVVAHELGPERIGRGREPERRADMARMGLQHGVHGQGADRVDGELGRALLARALVGRGLGQSAHGGILRPSRRNASRAEKAAAFSMAEQGTASSRGRRWSSRRIRRWPWMDKSAWEKGA